MLLLDKIGNVLAEHGDLHLSSQLYGRPYIRGITEHKILGEWLK
jgi:hypothetical protein